MTTLQTILEEFEKKFVPPYFHDAAKPMVDFVRQSLLAYAKSVIGEKELLRADMAENEIIGICVRNELRSQILAKLEEDSKT